MAVSRKLSKVLRDRKGDAAIEFIMVTAMLILVFSVLVTALVYVTQVYSASYITRRVVRQIETTGEYNEHTVQSLVKELGGDALSGVKIQVEAGYCSGKKIQLRDGFSVTLTANYPVRIVQFGSSVISLDLPIQIRLAGRSEVYWK
jgi:hypothetical protein